jgi:chemotaxis family two-component system sensor kinase Cph1
LTALRLTLGMLRDAVIGNREYRQRLDTIDMMVGALDRNLDFLAWGLRPVALDDVGLSAALAEFVRQWSISTSIPAEYHESNADQVRFAPDVESNLYRIVQEALNNIAKHSGAAAASVLLEYRGDTVTLIVEDDGGGFDSDRAWSNRTRHGGIGLISIHERAALMGGQVQFESTPGKGTTLFVRIPVPKP